MIRFLDFQETLALACAATGPFYVYGEHEAPVLVSELKKKKNVLAVLFETTLSLDVCSFALSYDIPVLLPCSLEELYRMLINAPDSAVIYVCREVMRMKQGFETAGYLMKGELRQIPRAVGEALKTGDIESAIEIYMQLERSQEDGGTKRAGGDAGRGRGRLMHVHKRGNASACVITLGYTSPMIRYLCSESEDIDIVVVSGFSRRVMRELKLLAGGYERIIWTSVSDTICTGMICDSSVRKIIARSIDPLYESLMAMLPKKLRKQLHYPGRPEEWPMRHIPAVSGPERRMCPGCIYRDNDVRAAHCVRLGIDVYRSECDIPVYESTGSGKCTLPIIGRPGERCVKSEDRRYAVKRFLCNKCGICVRDYGCPAMVTDALGCTIDAHMCSGCGGCERICPEDAIYHYDIQ